MHGGSEHQNATMVNFTKETNEISEGSPFELDLAKENHLNTEFCELKLTDLIKGESGMLISNRTKLTPDRKTCLVYSSEWYYNTLSIFSIKNGFESRKVIKTPSDMGEQS
jgi:hypothetical protein